MKTRGLGFLAKNTCINKPIQTVKNYREEPRYQIDYMLSHVVSGKTLRRTDLTSLDDTLNYYRLNTLHTWRERTRAPTWSERYRLI